MAKTNKYIKIYFIITNDDVFNITKKTELLNKIGDVIINDLYIKEKKYDSNNINIFDISCCDMFVVDVNICPNNNYDIWTYVNYLLSLNSGGKFIPCLYLYDKNYIINTTHNIIDKSILGLTYLTMIYYTFNEFYDCLINFCVILFNNIIIKNINDFVFKNNPKILFVPDTNNTYNTNNINCIIQNYAIQNNLIYLDEKNIIEYCKNYNYLTDFDQMMLFRLTNFDCLIKGYIINNCILSKYNALHMKLLNIEPNIIFFTNNIYGLNNILSNSKFKKLKQYNTNDQYLFDKINCQINYFNNSDYINIDQFKLTKFYIDIYSENDLNINDIIKFEYQYNNVQIIYGPQFEGKYINTFCSNYIMNIGDKLYDVDYNKFNTILSNNNNNNFTYFVKQFIYFVSLSVDNILINGVYYNNIDCDLSIYNNILKPKPFINYEIIYTFILNDMGKIDMGHLISKCIIYGITVYNMLCLNNNDSFTYKINEFTNLSFEQTLSLLHCNILLLSNIIYNNYGIIVIIDANINLIHGQY